MRCLLINPWIDDFAAYDLWFKPLGLLKIAAYLKRLGVNVSLIDCCLDRLHPRLKKVYFYTPKGLHIRFITPELAEFLKESGFVQPRRGLETISVRR